MSFIIPFTTFYIVANPATFKAVRGVAGNWVASADGLPTMLGLLFHSLVFVILCRLILNLLTVSKSGYGHTKEKEQMRMKEKNRSIMKKIFG